MRCSSCRLWTGRWFAVSPPSCELFRQGGTSCDPKQPMSNSSAFITTCVFSPTTLQPTLISRAHRHTYTHSQTYIRTIKHTHAYTGTCWHLLCRQPAGPRSATDSFQCQRRVPETLCHRASGLSRLWIVPGWSQNSTVQGIIWMTVQAYCKSVEALHHQDVLLGASVLVLDWEEVCQASRQPSDGSILPRS